MRALLSLVTAVVTLGVVMSGCCRVTTSPRISAQVVRHKTVSAEGVEEVRLESRNGSVAVQPSDADEIDVTFEVTGRAPTHSRAKELTRETRSFARREGGVLVIETRLPKRRSGREEISCDYELKIPPRIAVTVSTSNGSIEVEDRTADCNLSTSNGGVVCSRITGAVSISTSNGRVKLTDSDGDVRLATANGSIIGTNLELGATLGVFKTSNAAIKLSDVKGSLDASTSNGKLSVDFSSLGSDDIRLDTSNANVELGLPKGAQVSVSASTSNGSVDSTFPFDSSYTSGSVSKKAGEFSTASPKIRISITTSNASVDIRPSKLHD